MLRARGKSRFREGLGVPVRQPRAGIFPAGTTHFFLFFQGRHEKFFRFGILRYGFYATFYMFDANMLLQVHLMEKSRYSLFRTAAMRNVTLITVLALAAWCLVLPAAAHPPSDIVISYDPGSEKLSVTVTHPTPDSQAHYIRQVLVKQNGRVISDPDYKSQPAKDTFTYTYDVKGLPGDTFTVLATCNLAGSLEKKYDIPVPATVTAAAPAPPAAPAPVPTQKSPAGILPLLGACGIVLALRK